jgi:hypothetical protein
MLSHDFLDTSHLPILQADLDSARVCGRFGQDVLDNAARQFARSLILFQYDQHGHTGFYVGAGLSVQPSAPRTNSIKA